VADSGSAAAPVRETLRPGVTTDMFNELQLEVAELRAEVNRLKGLIEPSG
jgi:hypothetical protein